MIAPEQCQRPVTERLSDGSSVPARAAPHHNAMTGTCKATNGRAVPTRTILLVEDDETLRRLIRLILKGSGWESHVLTSMGHELTGRKKFTSSARGSARDRA